MSKRIFSAIEKKTFLDILKLYSNIIENKDTDGVNLTRKNQAWEAITRSYNASPHTTFEVQSKQLRRLWMNLKQRQRGALAKERQHRMATGGGPSTANTNIDADVAQVAPALIVGVENAIDSDTLDYSTQAQVNEEVMEPVPEFTYPYGNYQNIEIIVEPGSDCSFSQASTASSLRTPISPISITTATHTLTSTTTPTTAPLTASIPVPSTASIPAPSTVPIPAPSTAPTTSQQLHHSSLPKLKMQILETDHRERQRRAEELHDLEIQIVKERVREAKAKADFAELILQRQYAAGTS